MKNTARGMAAPNQDNAMTLFIKNRVVLAGGEGSRGGKVVGHTESGKPIYAHAHHDGHSGFTKKDHVDSERAHRNEADKHFAKNDALRRDASAEPNRKKRHQLFDKSEHHREKAAFHLIQQAHHRTMGGGQHDSTSPAGEFGHADTIGVTKSGKGIHDGAYHSGHHHFTKTDHKEATELHRKLAKTADKTKPPLYQSGKFYKLGFSQQEQHRNQANHHIRMAKKL